MANAYRVFFFNRPLMPGDIGQALKDYGGVPVAARLDPSNAKLAGELPETAQVEYCAGTLKTEVWLADQEVTPVNRQQKVLDIPAVLFIQDNALPASFETDDVSIMGQMPNIKRQRGRPRIIGSVMSRTTRWRRRREAARRRQEALI